MRYICDFHIHSKYSRATSRDMDVETLEKWARIKGISVLGTGDFTHPLWLKELKEKLEPAEDGLYKISKGQKTNHGKHEEVRFILTSEVSCIYTKGGKPRRIHLIIFAPSFKAVDKINAQLSWSGNLSSDGRPILGIEAKEILKIMLSSSSDCLMIPAHIWTPWYSLFGSRSGFNSLEECFEDYSSYIFALETGLSSDPAMNWRLSTLDKYTLISNSDSHSPRKIGREANVFEGKDLSYNLITEAIKNNRKSKFDSFKLIYTIEFFPEEGKYHYDGHRLCQISLSPEERKRYGGICPNCGKAVTVGVLSRVDELADREEGFIPTGVHPFKKFVPLAEIITEVFSQASSASKIVNDEYQRLINHFGNEFKILLDTSVEEISKISPKVAQGIIKVREGEIQVAPGYDGEYGKVRIFNREEEKKMNQKTLF